jgi:hypothetical protein
MAEIKPLPGTLAMYSGEQRVLDSRIARVVVARSRVGKGNSRIIMNECQAQGEVQTRRQSHGRSTMPHPGGALFALAQRDACFFYTVKKTFQLAAICSSAKWEATLAAKRK